MIWRDWNISCCEFNRVANSYTEQAVDGVTFLSMKAKHSLSRWGRRYFFAAYAVNIASSTEFKFNESVIN